jgi:hypothetical protein
VPVAASPSTPTSPVTTTPSARPDYIPEAHWDATAGKVKDDKAVSAYFNEIITRDAAEASRRLTLPQNADAYKIELPGDFKPPEGVKFEFKTDDPLLAQARTLAHQSGLSQENFSKLLGLYAGAQVSDAQSVSTARNAEIAKLGATGPARVDAVTTVFKGVLGDADGALLASRMFTARDVEVMEKLVSRLTTQGGASFNASHREADAGAKLSDADYDKLTYTEKKEYAERHSKKAAA